MKQIKWLVYLLIVWSPNIMAQNDIVYDIDSNIYHPINVGGHTWLKENLKVKHYNNGDKIPTTKNPNTYIEDTQTPKYQWAYNGKIENFKIYGLMYTYHVVADDRKICPTGWHVSTDNEWSTMEKAIGGRSKAGGKLKEAGLEHWNKPNEGAKKTTEFTALPGGSRESGNFDYLKIIGYWWTATENNDYSAWGRRMMTSEKTVSRSAHNKHVAMPVRCVKD